MSSVIHKYVLPNRNNRMTLTMPASAIVLSIANQDGNLVLWAVRDVDDATAVSRIFEVRGTGVKFLSSDDVFHTFIGTAIMPNGLVWHVFEVVKK